MTQVGTGNYTYELIQDFPKLPPGESFGIVSTVATDSQDRLYVFQRQDPPVMVFDRAGNYLNCWGIGAIADPHGMTIVDDIVYITDRSDSVAVTFTLDGKPLQVIGKRGVYSDTGCEKPGDLVPRAAGPFNTPTELVPGPPATYVSDGYRNSRVHRFTRDGQFTIPAPGKTAPASSTSRTACWSLQMVRSTSATAPTGVCKFSLPMGSSSACGLAWVGRTTLPGIRMACFTSVSRRPMASHRLSASAMATGGCWRAGRSATRTGYGWTRAETSTWG